MTTAANGGVESDAGNRENEGYKLIGGIKKDYKE